MNFVNMKSKIFFIGILGLLFTSCGEEFLNVPSETSLTSEIYFQTENDFASAINAAYSPLRDMFNGDNGAWALNEMHSDNSRYLFNPDYRATLDQENVGDFIFEASNGISTEYYRTNYSIVARANQIIATIDDVEFSSESVKNNIKGQALFLRAYSYFNLVQTFGSVPVHLEPVTTIEETALPLSEASVVNGQIKTDLNAIINSNLLSEKSDVEPGRVTMGAAKMLLANVYMVEEDYASAETLLEEIVNSGEYSLMADYADVFDPANKNNSESIFEVQYRQGSDGYSSTFPYSFLPTPLSLETMAELTGVGNPNARTIGEGYNIPSPDLINAYEAGDLRLDATIGYVTTSRGFLSPFCMKYTHQHELLENADDNWPVYRYSEVLLFLAEAINEQNRPTEALTYINDAVGSSAVSIRERAGLASITATSQDDVRVAIANERRVELAFENKRWPDLVRTGKAMEVMSAYGQSVKDNPQDYYFPEGYSAPAAAFTNIQLLWPLPADESLYSDFF